MKTGWVLTLAAGLTLAASGCTGSGSHEVWSGSATIARDELPGDSLLPMEEMIRRFRLGLPVVTALTGGVDSRDALVAHFVRAVETADSVALKQLVVSKAEYAHLYFPTSTYAARPYELPPEVAWMLSSAGSEKGRTRVLGRLGGQPLRYGGYSCTDEVAEGANRFWRACTIEYAHPGAGRVARRLFGTIIEREGRYKFLSYSNDF